MLLNIAQTLNEQVSTGTLNCTWLMVTYCQTKPLLTALRRGPEGITDRQDK